MFYFIKFQRIRGYLALRNKYEKGRHLQHLLVRTNNYIILEVGSKLDIYLLNIGPGRIG
jgi:hypothetical protein